MGIVLSNSPCNNETVRYLRKGIYQQDNAGCLSKEEENEQVLETLSDFEPGRDTTRVWTGTNSFANEGTCCCAHDNADTEARSSGYPNV